MAGLPKPVQLWELSIWHDERKWFSTCSLDLLWVCFLTFLLVHIHTKLFQVFLLFHSSFSSSHWSLLCQLQKEMFPQEEQLAMFKINKILHAWVWMVNLNPAVIIKTIEIRKKWSMFPCTDDAVIRPAHILNYAKHSSFPFFFFVVVLVHWWYNNLAGVQPTPPQRETCSSLPTETTLKRMKQLQTTNGWIRSVKMKCAELLQKCVHCRVALTTNHAGEYLQRWSADGGTSFSVVMWERKLPLNWLERNFIF